jgi:hypothetical protein
MRLPRMTTRRWMVAVGIVGLLMSTALSGYRLKQRRDDYLSRAQLHSAEFFMRAHKTHLIIRTHRNRDDYLDTQCLISGYHAAMASKYRHAALYPWLPVEPDPPEPEPLPSGATSDL